VMVLS
jgi:hypothetical protein